MGLCKDCEKGRRGQWVVSDVPFRGCLSSRCRFSQGQELGRHPILWALGERNGDHWFQSHLRSLWNRRPPWSHPESLGMGCRGCKLCKHLKWFWAHTNSGHYWVSRTMKGKWKTHYSVRHSKWKINQCFGRIIAKLFLGGCCTACGILAPQPGIEAMPSAGKAHRILTTRVSTPREVPTELERLQRCRETGMLLGPSTSHWWIWNCPRALPHGLPRHSAPPLNCTHQQYKRHNIQVGCFCYLCCLQMAPGRICSSFLFTL